MSAARGQCSSELVSRLFYEWAWVELNYRPHAYQATEGKPEVRQEICKSLTDTVICRSSTLAMPDNVGVNRQRNRQQKVLIVKQRRASARSVSKPALLARPRLELLEPIVERRAGRGSIEIL